MSWENIKIPDFVNPAPKKQPVRKYIFVKEYIIKTSETTSKQGIVTPATIIREFKIGDIIEGSPNTFSGGLYNPNPAKWIETYINGQMYSIEQNLVNEYSGSGKVTDKSKITSNTTNKQENKNFFTPKTIIISVIAIGVVFGLLKVTKVI